MMRNIGLPSASSSTSAVPVCLPGITWTKSAEIPRFCRPAKGTPAAFVVADSAYQVNTRAQAYGMGGKIQRRAPQVLGMARSQSHENFPNADNAHARLRQSSYHWRKMVEKQAKSYCNLSPIAEERSLKSLHSAGIRL